MLLCHWMRSPLTNNSQDDSGWTPLMIAASVKDADKVADILLARGADVNQTSMPFSLQTTQYPLTNPFARR
jgi:ankyrin repeat protein